MKFGMLVNTQAPPDGSRIPELYRERGEGRRWY
jgi:hypothetical protein